MGSKAQGPPRIPGPPTQLECAYLAALVDFRGGFTLNPVGLKIRCHEDMAEWLKVRFGGHVYGPPTVWWLCTQVELYDAIVRAQPHMLVRTLQAGRMRRLLGHLMDPDRAWHGTPAWRARRDELKVAVRQAAPSR